MQKVILICLGLLALGSAQNIATSEPSAGTTAVPEVTTPGGTGTSDVPAGTTTAPSGSTPEENVPTAAPAGSTPEGTGTTTAPSGTGTTALPVGTTEALPQTTTNPEKCVFARRTWGDPNLSQFHFCLNGAAQRTACNENEYYVSNSTISGCVPADEIDVNCRNLDVVVGLCTGINLKQPQISEIVNNFWVCDGTSEQPIELTCPSGAFVKQGLYLGCFDWPEWRELRGCQTYQTE